MESLKLRGARPAASGKDASQGIFGAHFQGEFNAQRQTDNGSCFSAGPTRRFAGEIGLEPLTTRIESPQSNGMAEAFVRPLERLRLRASRHLVLDAGVAV